MPYTRLMIGYGALFLSCVSIFMGAVVMLHALSADSIRYSYGTGEDAVTHITNRDDDPTGFWRSIALLGGIPLVGGVVGFRWGRRYLRS